jgi:glucan phosphoethanolaminetransferase (alkaline phosphatase superfamily)
MKIDSKFRIACLIVLFLALSWLLVLRYPAIASGTSSTSDIVILLLWIALMLAPIFQEVNLFGLQLRRSIDSLREQVQNLMFTVQSQTQSVNIHN